MRQVIVTGLLWFSALGCGVMAGVYFAFSTFIMTALARTGTMTGVAAMNAISVVIVQSWFMPLFMGTALASAILAVMAGLRWSEPGALLPVAGSVIYVVGMFVVTAVFNVPLNDALAASDPASTAGQTLWTQYLSNWTMWNHVRTLASLIASALFTAALVVK